MINAQEHIRQQGNEIESLRMQLEEAQHDLKAAKQKIKEYEVALDTNPYGTTPPPPPHPETDFFQKI